MNVYPQSKDEADKFTAGIIKLIHGEQTRQMIIDQLSNKEMPPEALIGSIVSQVITVMLQKVQQQAGGRKPHVKLMIKAINMTVLEVAKMAEIMGIKTTPEQRKKAAGIAGDMIESGMRNPQQQQEQPPQQPQQQPGILGGMNG